MPVVDQGLFKIIVRHKSLARVTVELIVCPGIFLPATSRHKTIVNGDARERSIGARVHIGERCIAAVFQVQICEIVRRTIQIREGCIFCEIKYRYLVVAAIQGSQLAEVSNSCEIGNIPSGYIQRRERTDAIRDHVVVQRRGVKPHIDERLFEIVIGHIRANRLTRLCIRRRSVFFPFSTGVSGVIYYDTRQKRVAPRVKTGQGLIISIVYRQVFQEVVGAVE